jgi:hypothetical protein
MQLSELESRLLVAYTSQYDEIDLDEHGALEFRAVFTRFLVILQYANFSLVRLEDIRCFRNYFEQDDVI